MPEDGLIYRSGGTNPKNLVPRAHLGEQNVSFRTSLSNPIGSQDNPILKGNYFVVDTSKLPQGSVVYDNNPQGHAGVYGVSAETMKSALLAKVNCQINERVIWKLLMKSLKLSNQN